MFSPRLMALAAATLFTLGIAGNASANSILALEDFHTTDDQAMSAQGWFAYFDSGAGTVDRSDTASDTNGVQMKNSHLIGSAGAPSTHIQNDKGCVLFKSTIDSTAQGVSPVTGLLGTFFDGVSAVELENYTDITFSWEQWSVFTDAVTSRVAIQIDSTWYVSTDLISTSAGGSAFGGTLGSYYLTGGEEKTFVIDSQTEWYPLSSFTLGTDASPGTAMTVGTTSVSLPATGTINAVGLYGIVPSTDAAAYLGFDNFEVTATAIPEPSTVMPLILGGLALCVVCRRGR